MDKIKETKMGKIKIEDWKAISFENFKPEVLDDWIAALRSDRHLQGSTGYLHREGRYCALGLLCEVVDPEGWEEEGTEDNNIGVLAHDGKESLPSQRVLNMCLAQEKENPYLTGYDLLLEIAKKSDGMTSTSSQSGGDKVGDGMSFKEIADWIEKKRPATT